MPKKKLPFGRKEKGRVPNPAPDGGALTLLINPGDPPKKGAKNERGGTMAKKKKKKSNPKKKAKKSNPGKNSNPGKKKKKKRKKRNPDIMTWNQGLEGVPQALPAVLSGLGGWATPGLMAMLIGAPGRKQLADTLKGSANAQLLLSTLSFGGWWAATGYFKDLKPYRKAILLGGGIRWFFDLANAVLPRQAGTMSANVRAFLGLPGGDMNIPGLPGVGGTTGSTGSTSTGDTSKGVVKVKLSQGADGTYLMTEDGSYDYTKADVNVKNGIYYDKDNGKMLVKSDGKTPWKSSDATLSGGMYGGHQMQLHGWQNFQPFMQQTVQGWQYFQPVMNGAGALAGYNVHGMDGGTVGGWQYFQPAMSQQGAMTVQGPQQLGTPPSQTYTNFYNLPLHGMGNSPARAMMPAPGFQFAGGNAGANHGGGMDHTEYSL